MTVTLCLSCSLVRFNQRPRTHCWMLAFFIASYQHLLWTPNSIGVSESPLGRVWPSLPHLVSSCLEFYWQLLQLPSWLHYIIVQGLHDRPLDLWNRMFNRHQAEITVMQFTGYSLPVHQSMSVSWALPCPISSANFRPRDFLSKLPSECVTSFWCITLE